MLNNALAYAPFTPDYDRNTISWQQKKCKSRHESKKIYDHGNYNKTT